MSNKNAKAWFLFMAGLLILLTLACGSSTSSQERLAPVPTDTRRPTPMPIQVIPTDIPAPVDTPTSVPSPTPTVDDLTELEEQTQTETGETAIPLVTAGDSNVNLRGGPNTDFEIVGSLPSGESLEIIGRNSDSSWWQVSIPGGPAWIAAVVTTAENVSDDIPVVESPLLSAPSEPIEPSVDEFQEAQVVNIVDGDTIDVLIDGVEFRVRYILVDTPETHDGVEPFGPEATEANRQLVEGKTVLLEKDVSETDRFDRLLRYVYVGELMVNEELLRLGLAQVATFPPDVKYVDRFLTIQQEAQTAGSGMWGSQPVTEPPSPAVSGNVVITNIFYDGVVTRVESDEYVEIANQGSEPVDMTGWKINAGDPGQDFYFPQGFVMEPGQSCRVYTNESHPETCGFSFGSGQAIWNNKGDAGFLYNAAGEVVSQRGY